MNTTTSRHLVWAVAAAALAAPACAEDTTPQLEPEREAVRAVWDPAGGQLPTPTDLARDPTTGQLALPIDEQMTPAEQEWRRWLNTLDGYPITSMVTLPVDGPLEEGSLGGALFLAPREGGRRVHVRGRYDAEAQVVEMIPQTQGGQPVRLEPGTRYDYGVWGYEGGARGAEGEPLVADAAFYFARQDRSLLEHAGALPGDTRAEREEAAQALEELRLEYAPIQDTLARFGLPGEELAVAGSFTTSGRPSIWFDPDTGQIPVPNDLLIDPQTGTVELPIDEGDDEETRHVKEALNQYDGFSTTGALSFTATSPVDPSAAVDPDNVRVFRLEEGGQLVEHTDLARGVLEDGVTVWVQPKLALEPGADYVYVVRRELRDVEGRRLEAQPVGALLRMGSPLVADGVSQIGSVDDESAGRLEPARQKTDPVLEALQAQGLGREDLALAVPFRTVDAPAYMMGWRAEVYERDVRTDVVDTIVKTPRERGLGLLLPSVETIVTGKLTTLDYLDPATLAMREGGEPVERLVEFTLTIPERVDIGDPIPTVIFGHGLMTSRELLYLIAEPLSQQGWAVISMDLALHGERSVCLRDSNCRDGGTCDEQHACVNPDGTPGQLERIESPWPDGPSYPITSGEPFIILEDIQASRDHFIQASVDLSQLVRVVRGADWRKATGGWTLDGQDVFYLGMSLGGILGSILTVIEPTIETFVLNVPGGGFFDMLETSDTFSTLYDDALEHRGIEPGEDGYFTFENTVRWMLDPVDPINLVQHTVREPLLYTDPVTGEARQAPTKRVMIQMAYSDGVVPNVSTELLSARMGIDYRLYEPSISNHAFLFDPTSGEGLRARQDMIEFFEQR